MAYGVPINSLQDLMLLRKMEDEADPLRSSMNALAEGVVSGIQEQQELAKKNKEETEKRNKVLELQKQHALTNKGRIDTKYTIDSTGKETWVNTPIKQGQKVLSTQEMKDLISTGDFMPQTTIKNGVVTQTLKTETPSQKATRKKAELDVILTQNQRNAINKFNEPGSEMTIKDLINAGVKPTDALKMEELRVPLAQAREVMQAGHAQLTGQVPVQQEGISQPSGDSNIVATELTPSGRSKKVVDINAKTKVDEAAAEVQVSKAVKEQRAKAGELSERGLLRAANATGTSFDEVGRFQKEMYDKYGVTPGQFFGLFEKFTPQQMNRYKASAQGAGREAAATVGMQIIPSARAVRMVDIFAKSGAEIGNTVEGNAANLAASMGNAWGNAISTNFEIENKDGTKSKLKDVVTDPLTGKVLSDIPYPEVLNAISRVTEDFKKKTEDYYLRKMYDIEPMLLKPETRASLQGQLSDEELLKRIEELKGKL